MDNTIPNAIVGDGNVARHFSTYLELSGVPFKTWSRRSTSHLPPSLLFKECTNIFILIKDDAIEQFIEDNPDLKEKNLFHFSGSLFLQGVPSLHPLMTFSGSPYSLKTYKSIPFIHEKGQKSLTEILPQLNNPCCSLDPLQKSLYHSLLVLSGNGTVLLWQKAMADFTKKLNLNPELLQPYMRISFDNLIDHPHTSLTGPMARQDAKTIKRNIDALKGDSFQDVYKALAHCVGGIH